MSPDMALRVIWLLRSNLVASGVKRTSVTNRDLKRARPNSDKPRHLPLANASAQYRIAKFRIGFRGKGSARLTPVAARSWPAIRRRTALHPPVLRHLPDAGELRGVDVGLAQPVARNGRHGPWLACGRRLCGHGLARVQIQPSRPGRSALTAHAALWYPPKSLSGCAIRLPSRQ